MNTNQLFYKFKILEIEKFLQGNQYLVYWTGNSQKTLFQYRLNQNRLVA